MQKEGIFMLCDRCKKNKASSLFTQNINGKIYKYHLCDECARNLTNLTNINFFLDDLLGSLISSVDEHSGFDSKQNVCPKCGVAFDYIAKTGKIGCDFCYNKFREMLLPSIKKLHVNTKHIGSVPASVSSSDSSKLSVLKSRLEVAIKNQEFELAAQLRDQINELKNIINNGNNHDNSDGNIEQNDTEKRAGDSQ